MTTPFEDFAEANSVKLNSSVNEIRQFLQSPLWHDMKKYISGQNEADNRALVNAATIDEIRTLQGKLQVGLEMLNLPETLLSLIEEE